MSTIQAENITACIIVVVVVVILIDFIRIIRKK